MFSKLKKHDVPKGATASYALHEIGPMKEGEKTPVLTLRPATAANRNYSNAAIKAMSRFQRARTITPEMIAQMRETNRDLYARFVLVGWSDIYEDDGSTAEFSQDKARTFLEALPDHVFDDLMAFASDPRSFLDDEADTGN